MSEYLSNKYKKKCLIDKNKPCTRKTKYKNRYKRNELEELYKICFPNAKISEIKRKKIDKLCEDIIYNYKSPQKHITPKKQQCIFDKSRPCTRKKKYKNRYRKNELENLYKICFPQSKISEIKKKKITDLCEEIIDITSHNKSISQKSSSSSSGIGDFVLVEDSSSKKSSSNDYVIVEDDIITELDIKLQNINAREEFIEEIINGKIPINNLDINYPYIKVENTSQGNNIIRNIPCNIFSAIKILKGEIRFLSSEKGVYGYPFKVSLNSEKFDIKSELGIKIIPYINKNIWVSYDCVREHMEKEKHNHSFHKKEAIKECIQKDPQRPENVELHMINLLSKFVYEKNTPHIILPIMNFTCNLKDLISNTGNLFSNIDLLKRNKKGDFINIANVLISEWATGGDLKRFILNNIKTWSQSSQYELIWCNMFFQLIFTLSIILEKYPNFRHNDLKVDNILVTITDKKYGGNYLYFIDNKYYSLPNIGFQIKLWDFDLSCIKGKIDNYKVNNMEEFGIRDTKNQYYDLHCFFNFLKLYVIRKEIIPVSIQQFLDRIIPQKYRHHQKYPYVYWSRVIPDDEYLTPINILRNETEKDGIFNQFLLDENEISKKEFIDKYNMFS